MRRAPPIPLTRLAPAALRLAQAAALLCLLSIGGVRLGGVAPGDGLAVLGVGLAAAGLAIVAAVGAWARIWVHGGEGLRRSIAAALLAAVVLAPAVWSGVQAVWLPPLIDVATNPSDPPSFSRSRAAIDARQGLVIPEFDRAAADALADRPHAPRTLILDMTAAEAFDVALRAAADMGWTIIDSTPPSGRLGTGRIDATARSLIYGFTDDIAIRIRPGVDDARIDVRSRSRFGRHDLGANARRIAAYLELVESLALRR